jgi:hypothetical protein
MESIPRVQVTCRIRPQTREEIHGNGSITIQTFDSIVKTREELFEFDHVFGMESTQQDVYDVVGKPSLEHFCKGRHVCIFSYGQTSSGKTYSLLNPNTEKLGLAHRIIQDVYTMCDDVKISFYEIYNDRVNDLLSGKTNLNVRENGTFFIEDLESQRMTCQQVFNILAKKRRVATTRMNDASSRSHIVLTIQVNQSKFNIIDLAGSEKLGKSDLTSKQNIDEAKFINQSLTCLGKVIHALSNPSPIHVPFRDSKLTKILSQELQDSFVNLMIHLSPSSLNVEESLSTLRFAQGARQALNIPRVKEIISLRTKLQEKEELVTKLRMNYRPPLDLTECKKSMTKLKSDLVELRREVTSWNWKPIIVCKCGWMDLEKLGKVQRYWCICYHSNPTIYCYSSIRQIQWDMQVPVEAYTVYSTDTLEMSGFYWQSDEMEDWVFAFNFLSASL